jgi:isoleucyl-tRNA synthetase
MDKPDQTAARSKQNGVAGASHSREAPSATPKAVKAKEHAAEKPKGNGKPASKGETAKAAPIEAAAVDGAPRDWSKTLFLPKTAFGMKAGLPQLEPKLLERWERMGLYKRLRKAAKGREKFVLHDGPPYANGNIHIGTGLNKILKDAVVRSQQMMGRDANYVPGWDCHGLPIEWKVEEQYRAKGKSKDGVPIEEFRRECREFAQKWIGVQMAEFRRLGVEGDWGHYYSTMAYEAEAIIANELMKFASSGLLYRGSKPVMWSVVERTALAEAEVEYHEHASPAIWVKFPVTDSPVIASEAKQSGKKDGLLRSDAPRNDGGRASIVIWTTTPWTIPGNRAISFSAKIAYGLYEVAEAPAENWTKTGERFILAKSLAAAFFEAARVEKWALLEDADPTGLIAAHPLHAGGYDFKVPLLEGDHVTEDAGTGFVHTAPSHGGDDFEIWTASTRQLNALGIDPTVPDMVGPDGYYRKAVPLFGGGEPKRVIDDKGHFGKLDDTRYANAAVIAALKEAGALAAMNPRHKHDYAHSWRSKAPVIYRNTPQWFIAMDKPNATKAAKKATLRDAALASIDATRFVPPQGRNRIRGMVEQRPDWVISRQRAWGVPISVFVHKETGEVIPNAKFKGSKALQKRIFDAFKAEGADAWFADGAAARFLDGLVSDAAEWEQVRDILDVWFDSGSTHAFVLEKRKDLKWPADLYLEGSDQHRGWFQSSLLESCGTRGRAPFDAVLTHGFVLDEKGDEKMSKSKGNTISPQDVCKQSGADILRLWALSSDFVNDIRFGPGIVQSNIDAYRKLRNTLRYMLGSLAHYEPGFEVAHADMPELERWVLHRVAQIDAELRAAYAEFDFKKAYRLLADFCSNDLSAIYFDIRKDTLYCEAWSSRKRRAALSVLDTLFESLTAWLAPILCFTAEEAWLARHGDAKNASVHLQRFPEIPAAWRDDALGAKWEKIWAVRRVITGALEVERREKRIGSSLEAAPEIYIGPKELAAAAKGVDWAEIAIASDATVKTGKPPAGAFTLDEVEGVAVVPALASGKKCARSWRLTADVGADPAYPDLSARDAAAVRELDARAGA